MIEDKDCYPHRSDSKDLVPLSEVWSEMKKDDPSLYDDDTSGSVTISRVWSELSEDYQRLYDRHGLCIQPIERWERQCASFKIAEAMKNGILPIYRNDGRRVHPHTFVCEIYLDRTIADGALRTISRDGREGSHLFVSVSEFRNWKLSFSEKNAVASTVANESKAELWLINEIKLSPKHPPAGSTRETMVRQLAEQFSISARRARERVWPQAIMAVPGCRWSKGGRRNKPIGS